MKYRCLKKKKKPSMAHLNDPNKVESPPKVGGPISRPKYEHAVRLPILPALVIPGTSNLPVCDTSIGPMLLSPAPAMAKPPTAVKKGP